MSDIITVIIIVIVGMVLFFLFPPIMLTIIGYLYTILQPLSIGKIDSNSWDTDKYIEWYFTIIKEGIKNKDSRLIFLATMQYTDCYWEKAVRNYRHVKGIK